MSKLDEVIEGKIKSPYKITIYGDAGLGKSTFAADAPGTIFLDIEGGTGNISTRRYPRPAQGWSLVELGLALDDLLANGRAKGYQTIATDSIDWLEALIHQKVMADYKVKSLELAAGGYGKGFGVATTALKEILGKYDRLSEKGFNLILVGHAKTIDFHDPRLQESYKTYDLKLHIKAADLIKEWSDAVLFASVDAQKSTSDDRLRVFHLDENIIHTKAAPGWSAKNRYGLPAQLNLRWAEFDAAVQAASIDDATAVLADISIYLPRVPAEMRDKVDETIAKAGRNAAQLQRIFDRIKTIAETEEGVEG